MDAAHQIYQDIAARQARGVMEAIATQGLVVRKQSRYAIKTDNMGFIIPVNINIQKYLGRRVSCSFNIYNNMQAVVPYGIPVMLQSISREINKP